MFVLESHLADAKSSGICIGSPELKEIMQDAYSSLPAGGILSQMYLQGGIFSEIHIFQLKDGGYEVKQEYDFGRNRRVLGIFPVGPRPYVRLAAHTFAENIGFSFFDYEWKNHYFGTLVHKSEAFGTLKEAKQAILSNVLAYIDYGRSLATQEQFHLNN